MRSDRRSPLFLIISFFLTIFLTFSALASVSIEAQTADCTLSLGAWQMGAPAPANHIEGAKAVVYNKLYLFTGFADNDLSPSNRVDVYNPANNTWETATSPRRPTPMTASHIQAVDDGRYIWLAGGFLGQHPGQPTNQVWRYDTVDDLWYTGPSLPQPRAAGAFVRNGRNLHYIGGLAEDRNTNQPQHWVLNLDNVSAGWQNAAALPQPRNQLNGVSIGGIVYAIAGQFNHDNNPIDVNYLHAFNPFTNSWTAKANLPETRSHFEPGTLVVENQIVIVGGRSNQEGKAQTKNVTTYNPATDQWTELRQLPVALIAPTAGKIGNKLIVTAGGTAYNVAQQNTYISQITASNCSTTPTPTPTSNPNQPTVSINDITTIEAAGNITFTVRLSRLTNANVTVNFTLSPGTAQGGIDYGTASPATSLIIPANTYSKTISVPLINDAYAEPSETFSITLNSAANATIASGESGVGVGTITNDDRTVGNFGASGNGNECNQTNFDAALARGGTITFDCPNPTTINLASVKSITNNNITVDGGGRITLDGGGVRRLFQVTSNARTLSLKDIKLINGYSTSGGGALYNGGGTVYLANVVFNANRSGNSQGGAIYNNSGKVHITSSTFSGNSTTGTGVYGGAILTTGVDARLNIFRSTFSNNTSNGDGSNRAGAIQVNGGTLNIANSTFANNSTSGSGGALRVFAADAVVNITNTTFSGNSAIIGSAVISRSTGSVTLRNSILTNSSGSSHCGESITNGGSNIVFGLNCNGIIPVNTANPQLGGLTGNPGYFPPSSSSPALNVVSNCTYLSTSDNPLFGNGAAVTIDQSGSPRPLNGVCDAGSTETAASTVVADRDVVKLRLIAPERNKVVNLPDYIFTWSAHTSATAYTLQIKGVGATYNFKQSFQDVAACNNGVCASTLDLGAVVPPSNATLKWRVVAELADGSKKSKWQPFRTQALHRAELLQPVNKAVLESAAPDFVWNAVPNADGYKLIIQRGGGKKTVFKHRLTLTSIPAVSQVCNASTCELALSSFGISLKPGRTYRWQVISYSSETQRKSAKLKFTIAE